MGFKDNREYISALEAHGQLVRIEREVDWDCEVGAIVRRVCETGAPAPFFQKIKDYPGHRIFGAPIANKERAAIAFGLDKDIPMPELIDIMATRQDKIIKPVFIDGAPCQQNVAIGHEINLGMFPAPMVHEGDGGRYISTWHFVITKDPETGHVNWGMYRQMVHNERLMGGLMHPHTDAGLMRAKYEAKGMGMPFATAIGPDPICAIVACLPIARELDEVDVAGGIKGEPIELVKCKTVDLEVPAHAEIVLEGYVIPNVLLEEGPFGEYIGYRSSPRGPRVVYQVTAITWRDNPILVCTNPGMPTEETQLIIGTLGGSALLKRHLISSGLPITGVYMPPEGAAQTVIVSTKTPYNHIAVRIGQCITSSTFGRAVNKVIVVDETTDPFNMQEVFHAMSTKMHPIRGIINYPSYCEPLVPFLSKQERREGRGAAVIFDCTWPVHWDELSEKPKKSSFREVYSKELQKKVLDSWQEYGFKA